jgi:CHAD domain-containing protein
MIPLAERFMDLLTAVAQRYSSNAIHDLRVTIRRINAFLELVTTAYPDTEIDDVRNLLRGIQKKLARARDADIVRSLVHQLALEHPCMEDLFNDTEKNRMKRRASCAAYLSTLDVTGISGRLFGILPHCVTYRSRMIAEGLIQNGIALHACKIIDILDSDALFEGDAFHRLRIVIKKLRYILEYHASASIIPAYLIDILSTSQEMLGMVQDATMLLEYITERTPIDRKCTEVVSLYRESHIQKFNEQRIQLVESVSGLLILNRK